MRKELQLLIENLKDAFEGDPWFGKNARLLLSKVDEKTAYAKPNGQHSILELVWHMSNWREFAIHCFDPTSNVNLKLFEEKDWQELDHSNPSLWQEGKAKLEKTQVDFISILQQQEDAILEQNIRERTYNYRKLVTGIIQHDIYHLGQIAYITKLLNKE